MNNLSKYFLMVILLVLVGGGKSWATTETIGATDYTTTFASAYKQYKLAKGRALHIEFQNYGNTQQNYFNWVLMLKDAADTADYLTLRADNYWWNGGSQNNSGDNAIGLTYKDISNITDWNAFKDNMKGATVEMDIIYHNWGSVDVEARSTKSGTTYTQLLRFDLTNSGFGDAASPDVIYPRLSVDNSYLVIDQAEYVCTDLSASTELNQEVYDFNMYAEITGEHNFSYAGSSGSYGYLASDGWLNSRFSLSDGTTNGAHRNYWFLRNRNDYLGLYCNKPNSGTNSYGNFSINNLSIGDKVTIYFSSGSIQFLTTNAGNAEGTSLTSGTTYTISASGPLGLDATYTTCITKVVIEKPTTTVYSLDHESNTDYSPWQAGTYGAGRSLESGDATYGKYFKYSTVDQSGYRECYNSEVTSGDFNQYVFEFDAAFYPGNTDGSQLAVLATTHTGNSQYSGSDFLFKLQSTGANSTTYTINGTTSEVTLNSGTWYHYQLIVDKEARTVDYSVNGVSGTYTYTGSADMALKEIYYLAGRAYNTAKFDNLLVWAVAEPFIRFSTNHETVDITNIDFTEPTVSKYPSDAVVTYTSSDESIAVVGTDGNVMMIDPGQVTITATITQGGTPYSASYTLDITAEDGDFYYEGTTATAYYTGKFNSRVATGVPGITMETGNVSTGNTSAPAVTVIREVNSRKIVTTLASNGWHDVQFDSSKAPTEGSYYVFKPTASGHLTVKGMMTADNTVYLVDASNVTANLITSPTFTNASTLVTIADVNLTAGNTYYLFGVNPHYYNEDQSQPWCVFQLHSYQFVPDYRFEYASLVYRNNKLYNENGVEVTPTHNSYFPQTVMNPAGTVTYACKKIGEVNGTFDTATGEISGYSGDTGGAYVVTATDDALGITVFYTLTIPYSENTWIIGDPAYADTDTETDLLYNKNWGASWAMNSQIKSANIYNQITNIQDPMLTNKVTISGDNAAYYSQTAGLLLRSSAKQSGFRSQIKSANSFETLAAAMKEELGVDELTAAQVSSIYNQMLRNYDEDEMENPTIFCIGDQSRITIPWATRGQYVKVYIYRCHTKGNVFHATNLTDLEGTEITKDFYITGWMSSYNYQDPKGAYIFKVKEDGPVSLTLNSAAGWTQVAKIVLTNEYSSDMKLVEDATKAKIQSAGGIYSDYGKLVFDGLNPVSVDFNGAASYSITHNGETARFSIGAAEGNFPAGSYSLSEYPWVSGGGVTYYNGHLTINSACTGNLKIVERTSTSATDGSGDRYVLDKQETWIAVGSITPQTYPKSWDFTQHNMSAALASTSYTAMGATSGTTYGAWDSSGSGDVTVASFTASPQIGTFTTVSSCTTEAVSINGVSTNAMKFGSSYNGSSNYVEITCEGGFKAGDVVTYEGVIRNSDVSGKKYGKVSLYGDGTLLYTPATYFANAYESDIEPTACSFTLTADCTALRLGRIESNTTVWVTSFNVVRPSATANVHALKGYTNLDGQKPLFASGSELTTGTTPLREAVGIGVSVEHVGPSYLDRATLDGNSLSGVRGLTIPVLETNDYVYVKASAEPTVTVQGYTAVTEESVTTYTASAAEYTTVTGTPTGVYAYRITSGENVKMTLSFASDAQIYLVAVTDLTKNINVLGYATESRDHSIDHTYTGEFTVDDVNAYAIQYGSYDRKKASVTKSAEVQVVPASTGVVLYKANASAACTVPLFHPAVNLEPESSASQLASDGSALTGNMMAPCVTGKLFDIETEGDKTVFIMARTFYTYQKGVGNSEAQTSNVEAFYRMKLGETAADNTMAANKAYLLVPTAQLPTSAWDEDAAGGGSARGYLFFAEDLMQLGDATAISRITTDGDNTAEGNGEATAPRAGVWYTLSGQRLQGRPTQSGIYIVNGKKCYIK